MFPLDYLVTLADLHEDHCPKLSGGRCTCDVVPPDHPSHQFPTVEERAAMPERDRPFAEGCGGCACLPGDDVAREPCDPPKPVPSSPISTERARLLGVLAGRLHDPSCGWYGLTFDWACCPCEKAARRDAYMRQSVPDILKQAADAAATRSHDGGALGWLFLVERLARELTWMRVMLAGMLRPVEGAYAASQAAPGQRAGAPRMQAPPLSVLVHLRRVVEDALAGAPPESSVSMDALLQAMSDREQERAR